MRFSIFKVRYPHFWTVLSVFMAAFAASAGVAEAAVIVADTGLGIHAELATVPDGLVSHQGRNEIETSDSTCGLTCPPSIGGATDMSLLCSLAFEEHPPEPDQIRWMPNGGQVVLPRPVPICLLKVPISAERDRLQIS